MSVDVGTLIGSAGVGGAVAGFYYTAQRTEVKAVIAEGIPFSDERIIALRRRLRRKAQVTTAVLVLHLPLTVLFVTGAITAVSDLDLDAPVNTSEVAVVIIAGLALMHLLVIGGDLRSLIRRARSLPRHSSRSNR